MLTMISRRLRNLAVGGALAVAASHSAMASGVIQTNLVSPYPGAAAFADPLLVNPWGIAFAPDKANWWVSDEGNGQTTVYVNSGAFFLHEGSGLPVVVATPPPAGQLTPARPTGQIWNPTQTFIINGVKGPGVAQFIVCTLDGLVSGWSGLASTNNFTTAIDNSASGAVYTGLALYTSGNTSYLLVTNFASGMVEVYNSSWQLVTKFRDRTLPANYAPFNVAVLNNRIYVAYAQQTPGGLLNLPGAGAGYVEQVNIAGTLVAHFPPGGPLNSPWGMVLAPTNFGPYANMLLVGNQGDGRITVYDPNLHTLIGQLTDTTGTPISITGLWSLGLIRGAVNGTPADVFFTSATNLFGKLDYSP